MTYNVGDRVRIVDLQVTNSDIENAPVNGDEGVVSHIEELDENNLWVEVDGKPAPEFFVLMGAPKGWPLYASEVESVEVAA